MLWQNKKNNVEKKLYHYLNFMRNKKVNFDPWVFLSDDEIVNISQGINKHYPYRKVICFAHSQGSDDYACFVTKGKLAGKFIFVHWFASPGFETAEGYEFLSFGEIFEAIINDIIQLKSFENLEDLPANL